MLVGNAWLLLDSGDCGPRDRYFLVTALRRIGSCALAFGLVFLRG